MKDLSIKTQEGWSVFNQLKDEAEYYHLLALLDLCKTEQSLPFKNRISRCLFYHLSIMDKIPELKSKCDRTLKEHMKYEKDNLEELKLIERGRRNGDE